MGGLPSLLFMRTFLTEAVVQLNRRRHGMYGNGSSTRTEFLTSDQTPYLSAFRVPASMCRPSLDDALRWFKYDSQVAIIAVYQKNFLFRHNSTLCFIDKKHRHPVY